MKLTKWKDWRSWYNERIKREAERNKERNERKKCERLVSEGNDRMKGRAGETKRAGRDGNNGDGGGNGEAERRAGEDKQMDERAGKDRMVVAEGSRGLGKIEGCVTKLGRREE